MKAQGDHRIYGSTQRPFAEKTSCLRLYSALAGVALALLCPSPARALLAECQTAVTNEPSLISYCANLTLSWPADVTGFTLEYAESVPATSWTEVSGVVNSQVTSDASVGMRFFGLRK